MKTHDVIPSALAALLLILATIVPITAADPYAPPSPMHFQGYLEDATGRPYGAGTPLNKQLIFRIYKDATSSVSTDLLWSEQQFVTLDNGAFSVRLGVGIAVDDEPNTTDLAGLFVGNNPSERHLGITVVGSGSEILPRLRFLTAPYAHLASQANKLINPTTGVEFDPFDPPATLGTPISAAIRSINGNPRGASATDLQIVITDNSQIASGDFSTIGGGRENTAEGISSVIAGGREGSVGGWYSFIGGGLNNQIGTDAHYSVISGGRNGVISDGATYATILGGLDSKANATGSMAGGRRAKALRQGSFVWADYTDADFESTVNNQFNIRASGGTRIFSNGAATTGVTLAAGSGTWASVSDRNAKENIRPVDAEEVLEKVASLPVARWNYRSQEDEVEHVGPMAQDFRAAFGLGVNDTTITTVDADGVALAAIKGLKARDDRKSERITELESENESLKQTLNDLLKRVQAIEAKTN